MHPVRRAAVSGLLAAWLAPLPTLPGGQPAATHAEDSARTPEAPPQQSPAR